jgi:CDP-glucose 4,6-dehydratase
VIHSPSSVRPWQFVLDALQGYLILAEQMFSSPDRYSEAWNFGPVGGCLVPVAEIARFLCMSWPQAKMFRVDGRPGSLEVSVLSIDSTKARTKLYWAPKYSLERSLLETVEWSRYVLAGGQALARSLHCLEEYELSAVEQTDNGLTFAGA